MAPGGGHIGVGTSVARVHRLASAACHDEPSGWCQKDEGDALNLVLPFTEREGEEMAGGKGQRQRRRWGSSDGPLE